MTSALNLGRNQNQVRPPPAPGKSFARDKQPSLEHEIGEEEHRDEADRPDSKIKGRTLTIIPPKRGILALPAGRRLNFSGDGKRPPISRGCDPDAVGRG